MTDMEGLRFVVNQERPWHWDDDIRALELPACCDEPEPVFDGLRQIVEGTKFERVGCARCGTVYGVMTWRGAPVAQQPHAEDRGPAESGPADSQEHDPHGSRAPEAGVWAE